MAIPAQLQKSFLHFVSSISLWLTVLAASTASALTAQTITGFAPATPVLFSGGTFTLSATGGASGNPVVFTSGTTSICTVSGSTVTKVAVGTCTLNANQAGNATYSAAAQVNKNVVINKGTQTITFAALAAKTFGTAPFTVSASTSSGLAVALTSTTPLVCTVSVATVNLVASGTCILAANQAGNTNYNAATQITQSFTVAKGAQTITFAALTAKTLGTAPFTVSATASSGLAVAFTSTNTAVCKVVVTNVTLVSAGTCTLTANQAGNSNYSAATQVTQSFTVSAAALKPQTITGFAPATPVSFSTGGTFTLSATGGAAGNAVIFMPTTPTVCTVLNSTATMVAAGTCTLTANQAGNTTYSAAPQVTASVVIGKGNQTITFNTLPNKQVVNAPFSISAAASSGLAVTFTSTTTSVCTISGATVTLVALGTCTINANQVGNANFNAALPVSQSFTVTNAAPAPLEAQLAAGGSHSCLITSSKGVKCWGSNYYGELGDGTTTDQVAPVDVVGLTGVTAIAAGYSHTCAVISSGGVKCWGGNYRGQLGDNSITNRLTPVDVIGLSSGVMAIAVGQQHTCAITTAGALKCWGDNSEGQLGDGTTANKLTAVDIAGLGSGVIDVSLGAYHSCVVTALGRVKCWGNNFSGQVGVGMLGSANYLSPIEVVGLIDVAKFVATDSRHSCVLTSAAGVKCWGSNADAELGDGTKNSRTNPANVSGLTSGVDMIASGPPSCAITNLGQIKCWGGGPNSYTNDSKIPINIGQPILNVVDIAVGDNYGCVMLSTTDVRCWGRAGVGQLGAGNLGLYLNPYSQVLPRPVVGLNGATKMAQTIDFFVPINNATNLQAYASSGLQVAFTSTTTQICSVADTTVTLLAPGTCTIAADQPGDVYYLAAPTATRSFQVSRVPTATTLYPPSKTQVVIGEPFDSALVSTYPSQSGDTISLLDGTNTLGAATIGTPNSSYSIPIGPLSRGTHTVVARYAGNATFAPSESAPLILKVTDPNSATAQPSSVQLTASPLTGVMGFDEFNRRNINPTFTFTATVTGNAPTGDITLLRGTTAVGNAVIVNGAAQVTATSADFGVNTFTVRYSGDDNNRTSTSAPVNVTVTKPAPPTVTIDTPLEGAIIASTPQQLGGPLASVRICATAQSATTLIVLQSGKLLVDGVQPVGNTQAQFIGSSYAAEFCFDPLNLSPGTHILTVSAYDQFGSTTTSAPRTITVTGTAAAPVAVTASVSSTSITAGSSIIFTGTATSTSGTISAITITENGVVVPASGSAAINGTSATFNYAVTNASVGTHVYKVRATTASGATALSDAITVVVNPGVMSVVLTAPAAPVSGSTVNSPVTVSLNAQNIPGAVTKVEFVDGSDVFASYQPAGAATSVVIDHVWTNATSGSHTVTVKITNDAGAIFTSNALTFTVRSAPTVSLSTVGNFFLPAGNVELTASAATTESGATLASVQFFADGILLANITQPPYRFTWSNVAAGTYVVKAKAIDSNGSYAETAPFTITVGPASAMAISADAGVNGSSTVEETIYIGGSVTALPNSAVTINGQVATVTPNGRYFINSVPLQMGINTITLSVTAADGQSATQNITVTRNARPAPPPNTPIFGAAVGAGGVLVPGATLPVPVTITITNGMALPTGTTLEVACQDPQPASTVSLTASPTTLNCLYTAEGLYTVKLTVKSAAGVVLYASTQQVKVEGASSREQLLRNIYSGMLERLRAGNINGALSALTSSIYAKYQARFNAPGINLAAAIDQLGVIQQVNVSDELGEFVIVRSTPDGPVGYIVYFILAEDGIWRIDSM
jgi:alpha-tubulin suppressor-like RCC1 family protein